MVKGGQYQVFVINSDGTNLRGPLANSRYPTISYDGSKIVYDSYVDNNSHISIAYSNGSEKKQLTSGLQNDTLPKISGDGKRVAFCWSRYVTQRELKLINSDGSGEMYVTYNTGIDEHAPSINYDGSKIAFQATNGSKNEIFCWSEGDGLSRRISAGYEPSISGDR